MRLIDNIVREEEQNVKPGSDRNFGLVFGAVFTLIGLVPLAHGNAVRWWTIGIATVFFVLAFFASHSLAPLNRIWFRFGLLLHKIVSPLVLGLMFYGVISPFAMLMRLFGKRPLSTSFERTAKSYWITRTPPGPAPKSMTHQF